MCGQKSSATTGEPLSIMTFGPSGTAPAYKRQGYGKQLLDYSMEKPGNGAGALAITGNIDLYGNSGFVPAKPRACGMPDDPEADYFLIKELKPGFLTASPAHTRTPMGILSVEKDPEGFEQFEATFPKEKKSRSCRDNCVKQENHGIQ